MRRLQHVEPAAAILRGIAPGVQRLADETAEGRDSTLAGSGIRLDLGQRHHLVDDAGELEAGLAAVDLRHEDAAIEVVELLVEDSDEDHVAPARMLQMREPGDHLAAMQPIAGTRLLREWQGVRHVVTVRVNDFEFEGRPYQSLSAIARHITGTRWNGWTFFGLRARGEA